MRRVRSNTPVSWLALFLLFVVSQFSGFSKLISRHSISPALWRWSFRMLYTRKTFFMAIQPSLWGLRPMLWTHVCSRVEWTVQTWLHVSETLASLQWNAAPSHVESGKLLADPEKPPHVMTTLMGAIYPKLSCPLAVVAVFLVRFHCQSM